MQTWFFLSGIIDLMIVLLFCYFFIMRTKHQKVKKIVHTLSLISISFLLISLLSFLWAFNLMNYSESDFSFIYCVYLIFNTSVMFFVIKFMYKFKSINLFAVIYLSLSLIAVVSFKNYFWIVASISYLVFLMFSIYFAVGHPSMKNAGYLGVIYSCFSLIFQMLVIFSDYDFQISLLISNIIFFFFIYLFFKGIIYHPIKESDSSKLQKTSHVILFIRYFIFIIVITNLALIGTLVIHEFGHFSVSKLYGCEQKTIFFEKGISPHTEILCADDFAKSKIILGGVIFPIIIALVLFFSGGTLSRSVSFLMIGFGLIVANNDSTGLGFSNSLIFTQVYFGIIFVIFGLVILARYKFDENVLF